MATGSIILPAAAGVPGDGSSGNAGPQMSRRTGTEANPKTQYITADFDAATAEHLWFTFQIPQNYASGGLVRIHWQANATSGNVVWATRLGATTPADVDTFVEHAEAAASTATTAANVTEARRLVETTITLANLDTVAAGDTVALLIYRDAANGSDTTSVDAELVSAGFEYTTT